MGESSTTRIDGMNDLPGAGGEPVPEEYIPARFNVQTELSADVKPVRENIANFELQSK